MNKLKNTQSSNQTNKGFKAWWVKKSGPKDLFSSNKEIIDAFNFKPLNDFR